MPRARPLIIPETLPECRALIQLLHGEIAYRRSLKAQAQQRWRRKRKPPKPADQFEQYESQAGVLDPTIVQP